MLFTFKRDDEGRERFYIDGILSGAVDGPERALLSSLPTGVTPQHVHDAIERADEEGFWNYNSGDIADARKRIQAGDYCAEELFGVGGWSNVINEVTVDVPIPAQSSTTVSVVLEGDES